MASVILSVRDLRTVFRTPAGTVRAVDGVDFDLHKGEVLAIVGESGSGKSVTALSIVDLVDSPGQIVSGDIVYGGRELRSGSRRYWRSLRGSVISYIFQDPSKALDPSFKIRFQYREVLRKHLRTSDRSALDAAAVKQLEAVGIQDPQSVLASYPAELSGGIAQRVLIALAMSTLPRILIADEPTTLSDALVEKQVLELLRSVQVNTGMAMILITHDFGVVAHSADRVAVMYAGQIVETGTVSDLIENPLHPYTKALLRSVPQIGTHRQDRLRLIAGQPPDMLDLPAGCRFAGRCDEYLPQCSVAVPILSDIGSGRQVRCIQRPT